MNSSLRSFFSAAFGPGLTVFTACSAYFNGPLAVVTTLGFAFTVVYGIVEIALLAYTPVARIELEGPSLLEDEILAGTTPFKFSHASGNVVDFPTVTDGELDRAA